MTMAPPSSVETVAVIGAGPGAMFFCHALETHRRELLTKTKGDETTAPIANLPVITCLERAPGPGGTWRSARASASSSLDTDETKGDDNNKSITDTKEMANNMYDALWTNGPKEAIEFFDYTYEEHFGKERPLPVYMPRQSILEYMMGRVTKHCPDFFEKYMQFNTNVESVRFVELRSKFEIVTRSVSTGETVTKDYDKCIWAAGMNGLPMTPSPMSDMLRDGHFGGTILHSSDTANFEEDVKGKRVLLIGGSYSAEDLALMAVKCGVEKVYVSARHANVISWTAAWPLHKVEILEEQVPVRVTENGNCIQLAATESVFSSDNYIPGEEVQTELRDIDTIIFCTGYLPNLDMLSDELRKAVHRDEEPQLPVPKDWRMTRNGLTDVLGDIEPDDDAQVVGWIYPGLYCDCISIENPRMMFMKFEFENPLFGIDVSSWLLMRSIVGLKEIPSAEEMLRQEKHKALHTMNNPLHRCMIDKNYFEAIDRNWEKFPNRPESKMELLDQLELDYEETNTEIRLLARYIQEAHYPVNFGSFDELNETANNYIKFDSMTYDHRAELTEEDADNGRTFRDYSDGNGFHSVFTGTRSVPLKHRWLDMDENDLTILEP